MARRTLRTEVTKNRALANLLSVDNTIDRNQAGSFDSDEVFGMLDVGQLLDSNAIEQMLDSHQANVPAGGTDSATVVTLIEAARDSDRDVGKSTQVFRITDLSELDTLSQHSGLGVEIGTVKVGDIAIQVSPLKAYVLTNISGPQSGYTSTGFRVQTNNGTVTRAYFDIVPAGQLPSENFAVGMTVARGTGGQDARTITAVSDTGAQYGGAPNLGYIDFTPSMSGYAPPFDNEYMHTAITPLTTWQPMTFDSSAIQTIINANVLGNDSASITSLIDSAYINARVSFDSDTVTQLVDSAYIKLRDRFQDSSGILAIVDSAYVQARQSSTGGGGGLDSAEVIRIVDSAGGFNAGSGGGGLDSAGVRLIADSAKNPILNTNLFKFTSTAPQTVFTGADDNGATLSYNTDNVIVFLNGILLADSADYTRTSTSTLTLATATDSDDLLIAVTFSGPGEGVTHSYFKYIADSNETVFTGADDNGATLNYTAGNIQVYLNGILILDSQDYVATDGSTITLNDVTDSGDIITISKFTGATGSGSGGGGTDSATVLNIAGELKSNMFRINPQTLSINTTIDSAENAHCAGPISFDSGVTLTINGNLVIS
jgi:hypothetical protein